MRLVLNLWETRSCHAGQQTLALLSLGPHGEEVTFAPTSGFAGQTGGVVTMEGGEANGRAYPQGTETLSPPVP